MKYSSSLLTLLLLCALSTTLSAQLTYGEGVVQEGVSRHHLTVSYLNFLGEETENDGLTGGISYQGEYSINTNERIRPLLGIGVFQMKYRENISREITALRLRPQAILNVYPLLLPTTTVQVGVGYTYYFDLETTGNASSNNPGSFGMVTARTALQLHRVTLALSYQFRGDDNFFSELKRLGEIGISYQFS